jgi:hypothetical protein
MILSHTHKFIFFCSSKVGTTSMEEVLRPLQEGAEYDFGSAGAAIVPKHIPPAILRGALPETVWDEYFKFVFVRNPWDWFVSQWFFNTVAGVDAPSRLSARALRSFFGPRGRGPQAEPEPLVRFSDELRTEDVHAMFELLKRFKGLPGRDGLYQSNWVYDMDDRMIVDYVGRYESLEADFEEIKRHLGLDLELPHLNRTEHRDYRSYYTAETRDLVGELWAVDVRNFDYSFDQPDTVEDVRGASPVRAASSAGASPGTRSY